TIRGVATNNWNWLYHGLWDRPGSCCPPGKTNAITEATKILRPGIIRFAGGLWANNVGWDRTGSSPEEGSWTFTDSATGQTYSYGHKYTPQMVDAFADFATKVGAKAIVQMNVCDNNPKMWADLLRYTNIEKRYGFEYWELGNEQTLDPCGLDAASYAARYASYRVALKAVDPTIKMLGPVAHMPSYPDWEDTLVGTVGNAVDVLTWHWYQLTEWTSDTGSFAYQGGSIEALFAHDGNVGSVCQEGFGCTSSDPQGGNIAPDRLGRWTYRRGIAEAKLRQVNQYRVANPTMETAITEFGPHAVLHEHPINSNHAAAIWLADILARHAYNKTDIITFYSLEDGSNGPSTTNSRGLLGTWPDTSLDVRPIYNTMLMYSKYFGDMLVKSSTSDPEQNIVGWASTDSKDPGTLKLMLVNFTDQPSATNISLSNFAARSGSAYEMTSDNPLSVADPGSFTNHSTKINGVLIPDVSIADPQAFLQVANNLPSKSVSGITQSGSNSSFSYTIPAYSAVSVVLNQDAAPSCQLTSASWNKSTAIEGEAVTLNVTGSSSCNGKQVNFEVRENDSLLEGLVDEPVSINPQPATFNGATATTTWVSEWQNDCNGGCLPPEYYFNVSLTDNSAVTIRSSDPLLEVEKNVIPTPTPTPSPTLAPTSTPIPPILSPTPTRTPTSTLTPTPTSIPIIPHRISGTIWYDDDNDGIVDAAEACCTTTNPRDATIFNVNATVNFPLFCGVVSPTPTLAPTATIFPTSSPTPAPTITPTVIPTRTPTPSATPVPSPSIILTPTPTEAVSPTLAVATSTPTPTSVPTPTPVPCALVSASWVTSSNPVGEGEEVTLNAVTNNSPSCIGKQVAFEVRENNSFVEGLFDRSAKAQPESSIISDNRSNTTWTAEYIEDGFFGLFDPPEYFFKAVVVGEGTPETRSTDPLLQVNRAEGLIIVGNPAATNITENSATIEWETNTESTSKVLYGLRSEHRGTTIEDTSLRTTLHSVPIPNLESCALYRYLVSSREREFGTIANRDGTFATLGCNGSVIDSETTDTLVDDLEGRDIDTIDDNEEFPDGLALSIPPSFLSSDAYFQILRLDHNDFVSRIASIPAGLTVANHVYHLNSFLEDEDTEVDNFVSDLTLSIKYKPTDIANIDEDTLTIYKLAKDGAWRELTGCLLDKQERTVTCTTSSFSDFVLLGEPLPPTPTPSSTPEPTQQPGGYNSPYNSPSDGAYGTPSDGGYGTPSYGTPSSGKQGDLNNDGKVNIFDVSIMLRNWNKSGTGDLNSDGKVNIFDASILLRNWSK
ncbi:hypothetical protein HYT32_00090, partial [Candidatus Roizmanbacteria bacterium]|nr:hypothetical protein [Candidatus Roizmanbacteria bacterium]